MKNFLVKTFVLLYKNAMKKICLLFGILFLLCNIVFANDGKRFSTSPVVSDVEDTYLSEISQFFKAKKNSLKESDIPKGGMSIIHAKVLNDGTIGDTDVYYSSGSEDLDRYWISFVKNLGKFKPLPNNKIYLDVYIPLSSQDENPDIKKVNFKPYMNNLQKTIKSDWSRVQTVHDKNYRAIVLFHLNNDGKIERAVICKSSGNKQYDNEALKVLRTVKLEPVPKEYTGKGIDIEFTFDCTLMSGYTSKPVPPVQPKTVDDIYYENLDKNLLIVKKNLIREYDGYKYIHALKLNDFLYTAYLLQSKVDCRNQQIGIKKIYAGAYDMSYNVLGFTRLVNIFTDDVKMQSPTTSKDTQLIYNYVCKE